MGRRSAEVVTMEYYLKSLLFQISMIDGVKSKSVKVLRKLTSPQTKPRTQLNDLTNNRTHLQPRRSAKQLRHVTRGTESVKKGNRLYALNKTTFGTPFDKSLMLSYLSTPNEKSFNIERNRMFRNEKTSHLKAREDFQSTEDDCFGEQVLKVALHLPDRKVVTRYFAHSDPISSLIGQFQKPIGEYADRTKQGCYGVVGFETIPFNYCLSETLSSGKGTFAAIAAKEVKELSLSPCLLRKPVSYDSLEFSDFEIIRFLGSGGFSQVFLARCKVDQQYCALKFIRKDSITTAKKARMLQNQRNILFSVKHDHLVDLLYAFETKHYVVFGLEYCPNGNLYSYLQKAKGLTEGQARDALTQILSGLEYLHQHSIIFRDIKLQNILFDSEGKIKITDFGLSKPGIDDDQITYSYCGSPQYMAPQMLAKSGHSYQVDFYALGILLYELLFGRSPFYASKKEEIFNAILHSEPRFPKNIPASKELKSLIRGLLAKNPAHRIGSLKGVREVMAHPWFKMELTGSIKLGEQSLFEKGGRSKDIEQAREMFAAEQIDRKFQKVFFGRSFVNRTQCDKVTERTKRVDAKEKKNPLMKGRKK